MFKRKYPEGRIKKWSNEKIELTMSYMEGNNISTAVAGYTQEEIKQEIIRRWRMDNTIQTK